MSDTPTPRDAGPASSPLDAVRARTPARLFEGRAGGGYTTRTQLELRRDHAAALDAVRLDLDLIRDLGAGLVDRFGLFEVRTRAMSKAEYLMRPDLGRNLDDAALDAIGANCPRGATLQVAIGDGLSTAAVAAQVPGLLPLLAEGAAARGWTFGRPFVIRHCRVGVLNEIGERLGPEAVVLLIGERPGLATAESLSAYMAYRPRPGQTDADRNLVSNIHARGLPPEAAAPKVLDTVAAMLRHQISGVALREGSPGLPGGPTS